MTHVQRLARPAAALLLLLATSMLSLPRAAHAQEVNDGAWHDISLAADFEQPNAKEDWQRVQFLLDGGRVHLRGLLRCREMCPMGVTTVVTLPEGARPPADVSFVVNNHEGTQDHFLVAKASGEVQLEVAVQTRYASFDGVSWDTAIGEARAVGAQPIGPDLHTTCSRRLQSFNALSLSPARGRPSVWPTRLPPPAPCVRETRPPHLCAPRCRCATLLLLCPLSPQMAG